MQALFWAEGAVWIEFQPMNASTGDVKIKHARTGLKLESQLYLRAVSHASSKNQSFAGYVVDLIATDLAGLPDTDNIPDIQRIIGVQRPTAAEIQKKHDQRKSDSAMAHLAKMGEYPENSAMRQLREVRGKDRSKRKAV